MGFPNSLKGDPVNKVVRTALLSAALIPLVACNSDDESANDLPTGKWLSAPSETDEDGLVTTSYLCFSSDGKAYDVELEDDDGEYYIRLYHGTYSVSGTTVSINNTDKTKYVGTELPTDLSTLPVESMGDDTFAYSASFAVDGDKVTLSLMGVSVEKTPVATVPAYMAGISCK